MRAGTVRAGFSARGWPSLGIDRRVLAYMIAVDLLAIVLSVRALVHTQAHGRDWAALVLLVVIAVAFEEGSRRAARLQIRLSAELRTDMTSVWAVAGALALPPALAVLLLGTVLEYVWFRHQRPANEPLYRKHFVLGTALLGCLAAGAADSTLDGLSRHLPLALAGAVPAVAALLAYTAVNRALVTVVLVAMGVRGRALIGSKDDNLIELATLCLGGLVALAVSQVLWLALLVIAPMVTLQRGALLRDLETAASTDHKTGLLNAVAWEQLAQRELSRADRDQSPVALLIIDIDRFKLVNDRYGHLAGDTVLRGIGRSLGAAMREYDTVGRFGGEEFVAVLPEADEIAALVVAERVRSRVNRMRVSDLVDGLDPVHDDLLAVSIGVACSPMDGFELSDLLHAADQALYRAKESGRNQVQLAYRGSGPAPVRDGAGPLDRRS